MCSRSRAFCQTSRNSSIVFFCFAHHQELLTRTFIFYFFFWVFHQENCDLHKKVSFCIRNEEWEYDFSIDSVRLLMTNAQDESSRLFRVFFLSYFGKVSSHLTDKTVKGFNLKTTEKGVQCERFLNAFVRLESLESLKSLSKLSLDCSLTRINSAFTCIRVVFNLQWT